MSRKAERPDSARSWAVACAAFTINILLSGISRTTGLFYVALIDTYGVSRMEANMPFTIRNIVRNLLGPLVGAIGHRYGAREVTMAGGIFAGLGIALCAVAPDVRWISFLWGGVHGVGVALGNTLFQVIVSQYFEKHRATALGLAFSGGCVGSFTFPIILEYMLIHIGLSGSFLLTSAVIFHVIPAGILMTEPSWIKTAKSALSLSRNKTCEAVSGQNSPPKMRDTSFKEKNGDIFAIAFKRISSTHDINSKIHQSLNSVKDKERYVEDSVEKNRQDMPNSKVHPPETQDVSIYQGVLRMCFDPMFYIISLSLAAFVILFDLSVTIIVDYLMDKGHREDVGKYFICMISVGDFVGRLCFGWVTDRDYISVPKYMFLVHMVQGLSFAAMPFFNSFSSVMILVVTCGLAGGANVVMYPILVAKYLPSVQSLAIGCICFVGGMMQFGIPFMIGYFRDTFGSYDGLYFIIGGLSIVAGALWIFEPLFLKLKRQIDSMRAETAQTRTEEMKI